MRSRSPLLLALVLTLPSAALADVAPFRFPQQNLDVTVSPAEDFYQFAVGGYRATHPIPPEYARWGVFDALAAETRDKLHAILEEASSRRAPPGSEAQKVGDFYASGMDEAAIEVAGLTPILPEFERIDAIDSPEAVQDVIAHLQGIGISALFDFGSMPDPIASDQTIGVADQGGLGLPDPAFYLSPDPRSRSIREAYADHAAALLRLSGLPEGVAARAAEAAIRIEAALAGASLSRVERRDPYGVYHLLDRPALGALTPHWSWSRYFLRLGRPDIARINVTAPRFFAEIDRLLATVDLADLRAYLRLRLIDAAAPYLGRDLVDEHFRFEAVLTGVERPRPRWQRVLGAENQALGFALGKLFVARHFSPDAKARAAAVLGEVQTALRRDLETLPWMTPPTRARAIEKLDQMVNRVGYPDVFRDYTGLDVDRGPFVLNVFRAAAFETQRILDQIGQPTDREEWFMTPQTVNAYYDPSRNEMVFPAGILQPPFFDVTAPEAWNYGAIGAVMGHEITHGFDDEGSQYDARGNLRNWWTPEDAARFRARTACIAEQYSRFTVAGGVHVNGRLVTGEATADLGGVNLALRAFSARSGAQGELFSGFSPTQLFFLSFANVWAGNARPEDEELRAVVDPHPPPRYRVNGTLANLPAFQEAFAIPAGSPMVHTPRCEIW